MLIRAACHSEQQTIDQVQTVKSIAKNIVTKEPLTGTLNALGAKWYLEKAVVQGVVLTDMLDMHEGNARYGSIAIDQDLKRFSTMLSERFPKKEGFLLFRSERAGDEFKIISTKIGTTELEDRIRAVWHNDLQYWCDKWRNTTERDSGSCARGIANSARYLYRARQKSSGRCGRDARTTRIRIGAQSSAVGFSPRV